MRRTDRRLSALRPLRPHPRAPPPQPHRSVTERVRAPRAQHTQMTAAQIGRTWPEPPRIACNWAEPSRVDDRSAARPPVTATCSSPLLTVRVTLPLSAALSHAHADVAAVAADSGRCCPGGGGSDACASHRGRIAAAHSSARSVGSAVEEGIDLWRVDAALLSTASRNVAHLLFQGRRGESRRDAAARPLGWAVRRPVEHAVGPSSALRPGRVPTDPSPR